MPTSEDRLRPHPNTRETRPVLSLDLAAAVRALEAEPQPAASGHRQISLLHRGPLRLLLFAFEAGGSLPAHHAPGQVVIQALTGRLEVTTPHGRVELGPGQVIVLEPELPHSISAVVASQMLLTICLGLLDGDASPRPRA